MPTISADVEDEYRKNPNLRREDVKRLQRWADEEAKLAKISELHAILFLHSCYYDEAATKRTVENFFGIARKNPNVFRHRDPEVDNGFMDVAIITILPRRTPESYAICFQKLTDFDPKSFDPLAQIKHADMVVLLANHQNGTENGHLIVMDMEGVCFNHVRKWGIGIIRNFVPYLLEAMPVRALAVHILNAPKYIQVILSFLRMIGAKKLLEMIHLHENLESLARHVPLECLPEEYGGEAPSISELQREKKQNLIDNADFFRTEEEMIFGKADDEDAT